MRAALLLGMLHVLWAGNSAAWLAALPPTFYLNPSVSLSPPPLRFTQLEAIQSRLLDVGSAVATPLPTSSDHKLQVGGWDCGGVGA